MITKRKDNKIIIIEKINNQIKEIKNLNNLKHRKLLIIKIDVIIKIELNDNKKIDLIVLDVREKDKDPDKNKDNEKDLDNVDKDMMIEIKEETVNKNKEIVVQDQRIEKIRSITGTVDKEKKIEVTNNQKIINNQKITRKNTKRTDPDQNKEIHKITTIE